MNPLTLRHTRYAKRCECGAELFAYQEPPHYWVIGDPSSGNPCLMFFGSFDDAVKLLIGGERPNTFTNTEPVIAVMGPGTAPDMEVVDCTFDPRTPEPWEYGEVQVYTWLEALGTLSLLGFIGFLLWKVFG